MGKWTDDLTDLYHVVCSRQLDGGMIYNNLCFLQYVLSQSYVCFQFFNYVIVTCLCDNVNDFKSFVVPFPFCLHEYRTKVWKEENRSRKTDKSPPCFVMSFCHFCDSHRHRFVPSQKIRPYWSLKKQGCWFKRKGLYIPYIPWVLTH